MGGRVNCQEFTMWDNTGQGSYPELFTMDILQWSQKCNFSLVSSQRTAATTYPTQIVRYCNCASVDAILFCLHSSIKLHTYIQCCFTDFIYGTSHKKCPFYFIIRLWPYSYYTHTRILNNAHTLPVLHPQLYPSGTMPQLYPYMMKRVLQVPDVRGLPIRVHTFEVLVCSCSVLQCLNCSSASFQCLRGWFTQIVSNREFFSTTVPRRTASRSFIAWQRRDTQPAKPVS